MSEAVVAAVDRLGFGAVGAFKVWITTADTVDAHTMSAARLASAGAFAPSDLALGAVEVGFTDTLATDAHSMQTAVGLAHGLDQGVVAVRVELVPQFEAEVDIALQLQLLLLLGHLSGAVEALVARCAEALAERAHSVLLALGGARHLVLARGSSVARTAVALPKATVTTAIAAFGTSSSGRLVGAVGPLEAIDAEALASGADSTPGTVLGARLVLIDEDIRAVAASVAGEAATDTGLADTHSRARQWSTRAHHVFGAVVALEAREAAALASHANALARSATTGAHLCLVTELTSRPRGTEALAEGADTSAGARTACGRRLEALGLFRGDGAVGASPARSAEALAVLTDTMGVAVLGAGGVADDNLALGAAEAGAARALSVLADTAVVAVGGTRALHLALLAGVAGLAVALALDASPVGETAASAALVNGRTRLAGETRGAEALLHGSEAHTMPAAFLLGFRVYGALSGGTAVSAKLTGLAFAYSIHTHTVLRATVGAHLLARLPAVASVTRAVAVEALAAVVTGVGAPNVIAIIPGPTLVALAHTLVSAWCISVLHAHAMRASAILRALECTFTPETIISREALADARAVTCSMSRTTLGARLQRAVASSPPFIALAYADRVLHAILDHTDALAAVGAVVGALDLLRAEGTTEAWLADAHSKPLGDVLVVSIARA